MKNIVHSVTIKPSHCTRSFLVVDNETVLEMISYLVHERRKLGTSTIKFRKNAFVLRQELKFFKNFGIRTLVQYVTVCVSYT